LVFHVIIHCTRKLAARLPDVSTEPLAETSPLGSWHGNLLIYDRRQCLFLCHDLSRAVLFLPGVRKADLAAFGTEIFPDLLESTLFKLGCEPKYFNRLRLALGPVRYDMATDRSVLSSMRVAQQDLDVVVYRAGHVLDVAPATTSAWVTHRPARVRGKSLWPDEELLRLVRGLS